MIWYFLAGFVGGVVGTIMFSEWAVKHLRVGDGSNDQRTGTDQKDLDGSV